MTENATPEETDEHPLEHVGRSSSLLLRLIASSRFVFALAVFGTFLISVVLVLEGTVTAVRIAGHALGIGTMHEEIALRTEALEMVDIYLVATVLFVISMGFYQLLIKPNLPLPEWLRIESPAQLETKLIGVLVTVMGVEVLVTLNSWDGSLELLAYGLTAAAVIAALAFYTWAHNRHGGDDDAD